MELLFESRVEVLRTSGRLRFVQGRAEVLPEPVLRPDAPADATGANIYGSVLRDGGVYRMWYQAWPGDWDGRDVGTVGYAESHDGLTWHKPALGLVVDGPTGNNLCDLGLHSPAVFIDPQRPGDRYRATGFTEPGRPAATRGWPATAILPTQPTACTDLDGQARLARWRRDHERHHLARGEALVASSTQRAGGRPRRAVWNATLRSGAGPAALPSPPAAALVPDALDDIGAAARGHHGGDYYGMGMMPACRATVGFLWHFRHDLPLTPGRDTGIYGVVDVSLVYQPGPGEAWLHVHGRPDFLTHGEPAWAAGGIYTSANVVEAGDEQRLYLGGARQSHGWYLDADWSRNPGRLAAMRGAGVMAIGLARWRRDRLFGFRADPEGTLDLDLGLSSGPVRLNYAAEARSAGGTPRHEGHGLADAVPLTGDALEGEVAGRRSCCPITGDEQLTVRLHIDETVYAYDVRPERRYRRLTASPSSPTMAPRLRPPAYRRHTDGRPQGQAHLTDTTSPGSSAPSTA